MLLLQCNPDRIGHGTFLHPDIGGTWDMIDIVSFKKIPIGKLNCWNMAAIFGFANIEYE